MVEGGCYVRWAAPDGSAAAAGTVARPRVAAASQDVCDRRIPVRLPAMGGHGPVGPFWTRGPAPLQRILRAKGSSFCLLDDVDKEHRLQPGPPSWNPSLLTAARSSASSGAEPRPTGRQRTADCPLRRDRGRHEPWVRGPCLTIGNGGVADLAPRDLGRPNGPVPHPGRSRTT